MQKKANQHAVGVGAEVMRWLVWYYQIITRNTLIDSIVQQ